MTMQVQMHMQMQMLLLGENSLIFSTGREETPPASWTRWRWYGKMNREHQEEMRKERQRRMSLDQNLAIKFEERIVNFADCKISRR